MIFSWDVVTFLFLLVHFLHAGEIVDEDAADVRALATPPNIVRGEATHEGEYPFSVVFYEYKLRVINLGAFLSPICSGSIITPRWILTTALPLGEYAINTYFLIAGLRVITHHPDIVTNMTDNTYRIEMMVVHPDWHEYEANNLGMARTTKPFVFGKELGTMRIPSKYDVKTAEGYNDTICTMNIWAADRRRTEHLMGNYQVLPISKQTIYLNIKKDPKLFCPDLVFTDKTLCLIQFDPVHPHDICKVNLGAIVQCDCKAVGLFTGIKGKLNCVDMPPLRFTAVNLTQYLKWIIMISEAPEPQGHYVHMISSASCNLRLIYVIVVFKGVFYL